MDTFEHLQTPYGHLRTTTETYGHLRGSTNIYERLRASTDTYGQLGPKADNLYVRISVVDCLKPSYEVTLIWSLVEFP